MKQQGSYDVSSFSTSMQAEIRRLNAQVDLFWSEERPLLQRYGLRDGIDVLDCGCGPGRLIELMKGEMPRLRCTGLEMDRRLVEAAALLMAGRGLTDCRIAEGTAEQPGLEGTSFDFIILRLVLEHVPDPVMALRSMKRLLRPGGRLFVIANDFEFHLRTWPPVPQLDRLYEAYCSSRRKDGGDPCIGRRLPHLFAQAELTVVGYEIEVAHNAVAGDQPFLKAEGAGIPAQLVRTGFLDESTLEEMTHFWKAMLSTPDHSIMRPLFVCVGERADEKNKFVSETLKTNVGVAIQTNSDAVATKATGARGSLDIILTLVAKVLGRDRIASSDLLVDLGMDSLAAMELQEQLRNVSGVEIPIIALLENRSIDDLARDVDAEQAKVNSLPMNTEAPPATERPLNWEEGEV